MVDRGKRIHLRDGGRWVLLDHLLVVVEREFLWQYYFYSVGNTSRT